MPSKNIKAKNGFTIIEVVLVLAIAGLIFLMVFIALPQLQKSQRDAQRRDDAAKVATAITQFQTNNGGNIPITTGSSICKSEDAENINPSSYSGSNKACKFIAEYLNPSTSSTNEFVDPDGTKYGMRMYRSKNSGSTSDRSAALASESYSHQFYIRFGARCSDDEGSYTTTGRQNDYVILYKLEGSGIYCIDNQ